MMSISKFKHSSPWLELDGSNHYIDFWVDTPCDLCCEDAVVYLKEIDDPHRAYCHDHFLENVKTQRFKLFYYTHR